VAIISNIENGICEKLNKSAKTKPEKRMAAANNIS